MKYLAIEKEKAGLNSEDFAPYLENEARYGPVSPKTRW